MTLAPEQMERLFAQFALLAAKAGWKPESMAKIAALQDMALRSAGDVVSVPRPTRRVYKKSGEYQEYLRCRFSGSDSAINISFPWDGHRWQYQHTDFDDTGDFDILLSAAPGAK
jgi:hypothetical protein